MTPEVVSVIRCRGGYQACVEKQIEISFYPHISYVLHYAKGATIEEAIRNATERGVCLNAGRKKRVG